MGESVSLFREPDAGKLPVRFDEREQETGPSQTGLRWRGESHVEYPPGDYSYCACSRLYSPLHSLQGVTRDRVDSFYRPVPVRATFCGLPLALSLLLNAAVRVPEAVGLKVTLKVQLAWAASELPQVCV